MLYKRPNTPHWWVRFRVRGVEVRRSTGTQDRSRAERFEKKLREDAWDQTRLGIVRHTWNEATARWLQEKAGKRSLKRDIDAFTAVAEYFDGADLKEIDRSALAKVRQILETGRKPATVLRMLAPIRSVLRACVAWGWLSEAPVMNMPKVELGEPRHITEAEFERLAKELPPHLEPMARFSVETGQRYSAVAKLQWSVIDMKRRHAFVSASLSKSKKPVPMPLGPGAMAVLKRQKGLHEVYVFVDHKGRAPIGSVKTAWLKAVKRAGLEGFRWHDLRHTWASWHTMSGTTPILLKDLGGWASLAMVERYSHLSSGHLAQWADPRSKKGTEKRKKA